VENFITHTFTVMVDETLSLDEAVKVGGFRSSKLSAGKKDSDRWIFPKLENAQKSEKEVVIFHFNKVITTWEIRAEMNKVGYKPAKLWDIIGLPIEWPVQPSDWTPALVALGSWVIYDSEAWAFAVYYMGTDGGLHLGVEYRDYYSFNASTRFVAVRK